MTNWHFVAALALSMFLVPAHAQGRLHLDRATAAKEIRKEFPKYITKEVKLHQAVWSGDTFVNSRTGEFYSEQLTTIAEVEARFQRMANAGLVTYTSKRTARQALHSRFGNVIYEIVPTARMAKFIKEKRADSVVVVIGQHDFDKITGVSDNHVEFTTNTKFNELAEHVDPAVLSRVGSKQHVAIFRKYDDGWRLMKSSL